MSLIERPAIPHFCAYGRVLFSLDAEQYDYIKLHGAAWVKCPGCRHYLLTDGNAVLDTAPVVDDVRVANSPY